MIAAKTPPRTSHCVVRLLAALVLSASVTTLASAVDFEIRPISSGTEPIIIGVQQNIDVDVVIINESEEEDASIQGFQMAISHDSQMLEFKDITWENTDLQVVELNGGAGPEFYLVDENPAGGGGVTLGVIFQSESLTFTLGAGEHIVSRASYQAIEVTPEGTPTTVDFAASLGDPVVENKYTTKAGEPLEPANTDGVDIIISEVSYSIHFGIDSIDVQPGEDAVIPIELQNTPLAVYGFSFGVEHDGSFLSFKELRAAEGLTSVIGDIDFSQEPSFSENSTFYALNIDPQGEDGFTFAIILSSSDPAVFLDPANSPHAILEAVYTGEAGASGFTEIELSDELGEPPVDIILDLFGIAQTPIVSTPVTTTVNVAVGSTSGVDFLRGDVDQNGRLNITDATGVLDYLFSFDEITNPGLLDTIADCPVALNVDGSLVAGEEALRSINITDVIYLLGFLFQRGESPPAPFPDCGATENPVNVDARCRQFNCQ